MPLNGRSFSGVLFLAGLIAAGWVSADPPQTAKSGETEEKILEAANIKTDNASLLAYLRARTLTPVDRAAIEKLIAELDNDKYTVRVKAAKDLKERGRVALPCLKRALKDAPLELVQRAKECIKEIEAKTASEPIATVARLLALREAPGAAEVLFDYLPNIDDSFVEEEILSALGNLTVRGDKIDGLLVAALKGGNNVSRAAAAYILAQRGGLSQRAAIRQLLVDADTDVRERASSGLLGKSLIQQCRDNLATDLATLKEARLECQGPVLLNYLAQRTLSEEDQKRFQRLIRELGNSAYAHREKATRDLIRQGVPVLPFLRLALDDGDAETASRARLCIKTIKVNSSPSVPIAVVRLLALAGDEQAHNAPPVASKDDPRDLGPAEAVQALLAYLPFVDDETVEETVIHSLLLLSIRESSIQPALEEAMSSSMPARRAAAAEVLGRVGSREQALSVRALLADPVPRVRFRAAQGLMAAQDSAGVQTLIDLLAVAPDAWLWQVQEQLQRVAAGSPPNVPPAESTAEFRAKAAAAWSKWWNANAKTINLASVNRGNALLGVFTIAEIDSQPAGNQLGRVWECGRDGRQRWEITGLVGAMDCNVLSNGRVLVSEANAQRITERDMRGNILWTFATGNPAVAIQRLPNGNTFVCTYDRALEITPAGRTVYDVMKGPQYFIYGACRMKNGLIAAITGQGQVVIFDPLSNRDIKTIPLNAPGNWASVDALPNGRFLVALQSASQVREIDDQGKVHWQINVPGVFRAVQLPNGNVLACSMTTRRVGEFDRNGREVWGVTCQGRPWSVKFR